MKLDKTGRNRIETCKNKGGSDNHPNIISIPQPGEKVKKDFVRNDNFCIVLKIKLCTLYDIPSCIFKKRWYYKHTKR